MLYSRNEHNIVKQLYSNKKKEKKDTCIPMFIAALFITANIQKQPKCPSTDERIKKMWHIYTMEYYSAIKRNEIELFVVRWIDRKSTRLNSSH